MERDDVPASITRLPSGHLNNGFCVNFVVEREGQLRKQVELAAEATLKSPNIAPIGSRKCKFTLQGRARLAPVVAVPAKQLAAARYASVLVGTSGTRRLPRVPDTRISE